MSTEVQKTYEDMVDAVKLKSQKELVNGRKKMANHFKNEPARLAVSAGNDLFRRSSDVQKALGRAQLYSVVASPRL